VGDVMDAVQRDLDKIKRLDSDLAESGLARLALALASRVDDGENSATSVSMCAGKLAETLKELRELTPVEDEGDRIDDLAAAREARRVTAAAS